MVFTLQALVHESLPKIEVITQQFKLLMKVMESFHEEQGIMCCLQSLMGHLWSLICVNIRLVIR